MKWILNIDFPIDNYKEQDLQSWIEFNFFDTGSIKPDNPLYNIQPYECDCTFHIKNL